MPVVAARQGLPILLKDPIPHLLVETKKTVIHGWHFAKASGRRECSSERILINPYNGCAIGCPACYARSYRGHFERWNREGIITVFNDIDLKLKSELSRLHYASCGYFSPITDPFQQPLEGMYNLVEKCINIFLNLDLPVEFVTKNGPFVPERIVKRMAEHPYHHCLTQFSVLSPDPDKQKFFAPLGASPNQQLRALSRSSDLGLFSVVRIDPIMPGITDSPSDLGYLVAEAKQNGCCHIIASICDLNSRTIAETMDHVKSYSFGAYDLWRRIYTERQGGSLHASLEYRRRIFSLLKNICSINKLSFALCMEFSHHNGRYTGLNKEYMTSLACEGLPIPMYWRNKLSEKFHPVGNCNGVCLDCSQNKETPACHQALLSEAKALKYSDYKKLHPFDQA
ncbi:MAG: hypothetical protein LUP94_02385 [Candidatus Methanomethylicus sp.]|nr:hypothetical protein [Candidatus Methanomethylicus sp.]